MNKYREALENLKQRINTKENTPVIEELVRATEILEAKELWIVGRSGFSNNHDTYHVLHADFFVSPFVSSVMNNGYGLKVLRGYYYGTCENPLSMVFLTEAEAKAKAEELNKGEGK